MFKRKTTKTHHRKENDRMLHLQVNSPRILLFQSFRAVKGVMQACVLLALLTYLGWLGVGAVKKHFVYNDDFLIKKIHLETNGFMTHDRFMEETGMNMESTIFSVDLQEAQEKIASLPEVISVEMSRQMPSTVNVELVERVPVAWVASRSLGLAGRNPYGGLLVDESGVVFHCEGHLWDVAQDLPVLEVFNVKKEEFALGETMKHPDALRALSFINLMREQNSDLPLDRLMVENFYCLRLRMMDSMEARIGMYEHGQALERLQRVMIHAKSAGRELQWIDLLPRHNVPGYYKDSGQLPPPLETGVSKVTQRN